MVFFKILSLNGKCATIQLMVAYFLIGNVFAQNITISGKITEKKSGEALPYVSVSLKKTNGGVQSNQYGFYSLSIKPNYYKLRFSSVGYTEVEIDFNLIKDTTIHVQLELADTYLEEVEVNASKENSIKESTIGAINIPIARLKAVPAIFGEVDILKALALTPGISTSSEGSAGLLVRGGTPDQNLILLDEVPVYNVSHLFGLVSIFNPDVFKKIDLYKGGFPARYGGRLSSVIDVVTKDGNNKTKNKEFSIGLLSSKLLLEGPINKKSAEFSKTSYLIAVRSTYFTPFLLPKMLAFKAGKTEQYFNYWMYDSNFKINHQINQRQHLFLSFYQGQDYWTSQEGGTDERNKFGLSWGNRTLTLRYTNILSQKLFLKAIAGYTKYNYQNNINSSEKVGGEWLTSQSLKSQSSVRDYIAKFHFDYFLNTNQQIKYGVDLIKHQFLPSFLKTTYYINPDTLAKINTSINSTELIFFVEDEFRLGNFLKGNAGVRYTNYDVSGKNYNNFEPRVSLNVNLTKNFTLKAGFVNMNQNLQLLSSNTVGLPNDIWIPATANIPPSRAQQISIGLSKSFKNSMYELSIEVYNKKFKNLIDYPTGTNFLNTFFQNWENVIEKNGIGKIKGIELFLNKTEGKMTGWLSYTYMKNRRSFPNIDNGIWFNAAYDKRHSIATTFNLKMNKTWDISSTWVFSTGTPTTLPIGTYPNINNELTTPTILVYGNRNNYRMPNYHRLDLGFNKKWEGNTKRQKQLSFGFYNTYNQANPYYLDIKKRYNYDKSYNVIGYNHKLIKVGILPILPYISYNLKF